MRKPTPVHVYGNNGIPANAGDQIGSPESGSMPARYAHRFDGHTHVPVTSISVRQHACGHTGVVEALRHGLMVKHEGVTMAVLRAVVQLSAAVREHLTPYYKFLVTQVLSCPQWKHQGTNPTPTPMQIYKRGLVHKFTHVVDSTLQVRPPRTLSLVSSLLLATGSGAQRRTRRLQANQIQTACVSIDHHRKIMRRVHVCAADHLLNRTPNGPLACVLFTLFNLNCALRRSN